jgi:hypothetical protein
MAESQHVICDLCGSRVPPSGFYVVRIDVYADPSVPPMSTEELEETDFDQTFQQLLDQMKGMSADDLQDDVHRRFEYRLCRPCQRKFLANPLGMPRVREVREN